MSTQEVLPFHALTVPLEAGVTLVEASAGTGKTFAITRLLLRLLLERKVSQLSQVLIVTFTAKATQELVTRIRATLRAADQVWSATPPVREPANDDLFALRERHGEAGGEIVRRALASLDDLAVSTIHGFCQRMLAESALESHVPFRTTFIQDETEPLTRAARDWARVRVMFDADASSRVAGEKDAIESWVGKLVSPYRRLPSTRIAYNADSAEQALLEDFIGTVDQSFLKEKERRHLMGFDDLLRKLSDVLSREGANGPLARRIRSRFTAALIDEFQDTDRTQFPIFSLAFEGCPLFLIGDPKQSIFRFRGADIDAYLKAAAAAQHRYTLLENYRSTPAYVQAVEQLFTRAADPFLVSENEIGFPHVTAAREPAPPPGLTDRGAHAMEWWWLSNTLGTSAGTLSKDDARTIIFREVVNESVQLNRQGVAFGSIAVLVRSNAEARDMKRCLDAARIPSVIGGDADVFSSEDADELLRLAAAIASPQNDRAVRSAMATRLWGSTASEIASTLQSDGETGWLATIEVLRAARETWRERGIAAAVGDVMDQRSSIARLLVLPDGDRRVTNIRHLTELLHEAWAEHGLAPEGLAMWVARERTVVNTPDRRELRLETDSEAVQILTIHKAKGLQFDIVFCPTLWSTPPDISGPFDTTPALAFENDEPVFDLGSPENAARCMQHAWYERAESLRLAYVALTRAVHRCYIAFGEIGRANSAADSALGHLLRPLGTESAGEVLQRLVSGANGVMMLRELERSARTLSASPQSRSPQQSSARELMLTKKQLETWRTSSFSRLTLDAQGAEELVGPSSDADRDIVEPTPDIGAVLPSEAATGFRAFPAGATAGNAMHRIFELIDYRRTDAARLEPVVRRSLVAHRFIAQLDEMNPRVADVVEMVQTVCSASIPRAGFALNTVAPETTMREWRFDLSLSSASTRRIADVLETHGSVHAQRYARVLRTLRDSTVSAYLSGVVDLAFEHDGRWWIADWKTNKLGANDDAEYAPDRLDIAMMNGHYTLQYHLYLLALHRHLRLRQPHYDPALHWGGVAYVFLRGVTGSSDHGWFRDAPTPALLDALDRALGTRIGVHV
jgi:exodeoxyribonuclease V beta subunit